MDMAASAGSFTRPLRIIFKPLYTLRQVLDPAPAGAKGINALISGATKTEPFWEEKVTMPIAHFIPWLGRKIQWLQQGDFRVLLRVLRDCLGCVITFHCVDVGGNYDFITFRNFPLPLECSF